MEESGRKRRRSGEEEEKIGPLRVKERRTELKSSFISDLTNLSRVASLNFGKETDLNPSSVRRWQLPAKRYPSKN